MNGIDILLLASAFLASYTYIFYPLILFFLAKVISNPARINEEFFPEITIVISAFNEEEFIEKTIQSIEQCNYPYSKIRVLIGSDGSTDNTNNIVRRIMQTVPRITLYEYKRLGKNRVLNNLLEKVETEFVVLMDADISIRNDALNNLLKYMSDSNIGCTIASLDTVDAMNADNAGSKGGTLYHKYEENLRVLEAVVASNVNAMGALYCIRKDSFTNIPNDNVCDDLYIVYSIINQNKRVLFARDSRCYEIRSRSLKNEYNRHIRLVAGGLSVIRSHSNLLNIFKYGINSFFIWSHKLLRWLSPLFFLLLLIFTWFADFNSIIFKILFYSQLVLYVTAIVGWFFDKMNFKLRFFQIFVFFVSMNYSSLVGIIRFMTREQNAIWSRSGFTE